MLLSDLITAEPVELRAKGHRMHNIDVADVEDARVTSVHKKMKTMKALQRVALTKSTTRKLLP